MNSTGVDILDRALGGMAPGLPIVLAGPSGSGRTVLALELAAAALRGGRVVTYVCNEPSPFLLQQARTLGFDLEPAIDAGQLVLLELAPAIAAGVRTHGMQRFVETVRAEERLSSLVIVDPFTALCAELQDEPVLRATAREFAKGAANLHVLLTLESEQLALQRGLERVLSEVCGAFLHLDRDPAGQRWLRVAKSRGGLTETEEVAFEIGEGGTRFAVAPGPRSTDAPAPPAPALAADLIPGAAPPLPEAIVLDRAEESALASAEPMAEEADSGAALAIPQEPAPAPRAPLEPKAPTRVLVVDDDAASRACFAKWLDGDFEVTTVRDAFEAMTAILTERPELVVMDVVLPRVSGFELLSAFQRVAPEIPILVASSRVKRPSDRLAPLVLGATDLLTKPVDRFEFLHKVDTLLRLDGPPRTLMDPADAQALFADVAASRQIDEEGFQARLERVVRFGQRYGLPSTLAAVSAPSSKEVERLLTSVEEQLRFEDAVLRVSKRRILVLLLAIHRDDASSVLERLFEDYRQKGGASGKLRAQYHPAASHPSFGALFQENEADSGPGHENEEGES